MVKKRRRHAAAYKFRVALEALEGSKTISQLSSEYEIHANLMRAWKRQLLENGPSVFAKPLNMIKGLQTGRWVSSPLNN